ncbi:hypothetical protein Tco_0298366 [Tanacetum coccineum]
MCILIVPQQNTGFILDSDMEGKNEESYKFPIAVQQSFNSLWSQDVRGDPDSGIGGHWQSSDSVLPLKISIVRGQYNIGTVRGQYNISTAAFRDI